jgi:hypothetical protein
MSRLRTDPLSQSLFQSLMSSSPSGGASNSPSLSRVAAANLEGWMQLNASKEQTKRFKGLKKGWGLFWFRQETARLAFSRKQDEESLGHIDFADISSVETGTDPEVGCGGYDGVALLTLATGGRPDVAPHGQGGALYCYSTQCGAARVLDQGADCMSQALRPLRGFERRPLTIACQGCPLTIACQGCCFAVVRVVVSSRLWLVFHDLTHSPLRT